MQSDSGMALAYSSMDVDLIETETASSVNSSIDQDLKPAFICEDCGKYFSSRFSRDRHEENIHGIENETDASVLDDDSDSETRTERSTSETDISNPATDDEEGNVSANLSNSDDESVISDCDENYHPFRDFLEEALQCHHEEYSRLMSEDQVNANMKEISDLKRQISKTLRNIFVDYLLDLEDKRRDPLFKAIMRKAAEYEEKETFDRDEAIRAAVAYRKFSIEKLIPF